MEHAALAVLEPVAGFQLEEQRADAERRAAEHGLVHGVEAEVLGARAAGVAWGREASEDAGGDAENVGKLRVRAVDREAEVHLRHAAPHAVEVELAEYAGDVVCMEVRDAGAQEEPAVGEQRGGVFEGRCDEVAPPVRFGVREACGHGGLNLCA